MPQAPTWRLSASGAASRTSEPPAASAARRAMVTVSASPASNHWATPTPGEAHQSALPGHHHLEGSENHVGTLPER